jgi:hypothetical protein
MSFNFSNFDPSTAVTASEPIPPGWYDSKIISWSWDPTRDSTIDLPKHFLKLCWEITGTHGNDANQPATAHVGRRINERLNLDNPNKETSEIAREKLAKIMNALGVLRMDNGPDDLLGRPCLVRVNMLPANDKYEASNVVKGYRKPEINQPLPFTAPPIPAHTSSKPSPHVAEDLPF